MAFKSIMTFLAGEAELNATLPAAATLAERLDAHLSVGLFGVDMVPAAGFHLGATTLLLNEALQRAEEDARALETIARARLEGSSLRWDSNAWAVPFGGVQGLIGGAGRYADLVVQARPYGPNSLPSQETVVEAALFEAGVPVLILPDAELPANLGKRIVIGWNQSAQALAAVRRALPFLQAAEKVIITLVNPPAESAESAGPGSALCQMLVRHGVPAEVALLPRTLPSNREMLQRQVLDQGADMLVVGAYSRSRLSEAILGGTTRGTLENTAVPTFMAR